MAWAPCVQTCNPNVAQEGSRSETLIVGFPLAARTRANAAPASWPSRGRFFQVGPSRSGILADRFLANRGSAPRTKRGAVGVPSRRPHAAALLFHHATPQAWYGASVFWARKLAALEGKEAAIGHRQIKRHGTRRGIVEIVLKES